eukprot:25590-Pelagococcus_subviridis.AAC.1
MPLHRKQTICAVRRGRLLLPSRASTGLWLASPRNRGRGGLNDARFTPAAAFQIPRAGVKMKSFVCRFAARQTV